MLTSNVMTGYIMIRKSIVTFHFSILKTKCNRKKISKSTLMSYEEALNRYSFCPVCKRQFIEGETVKKLSRAGCRYTHLDCYDKMFCD
jgi:hypothetical protein